MRDLVTWITACLGEVPVPPAPEVPWLPSDAADPALWFAPKVPFPINLRHGGGAQIVIPTDIQLYARMIPAAFDPAVFDQEVLGPIIGGYGSWSAGSVEQGQFLFPAPSSTDPPITLSGGTLWVRETGEVWTIESGLASDWQGRRCFNVNAAVALWTEFLERVSRHSLQNGATAPLRFRLGVRGLKGLAWPVRSFRGDLPLAVADGIDREFLVASDDKAAWLPSLLEAWTALNRCFSHPAPAEAEIQDMLRRHG